MRQKSTIESCFYKHKTKGEIASRRVDGTPRPIKTILKEQAKQ